MRMYTKSRRALVWATVWLLMMGASSALAAPLRVLAPGSGGEWPWPLISVGEYLDQRLEGCKGVDVIRGRRAGNVSGWLHGNAFNYSQPERWAKLQTYVSIDAMIVVAEVPRKEGKSSISEAGFEVVIYSAAGAKRFTAEYPDPGGLELHQLAQKAGEFVARELKLDARDTKEMTEVRIDDPKFFRLYYTSMHPWSPWPLNSYTGLLFQTMGLADAPKNHWASDAAIVRTAAGYVAEGSGTRINDKIKIAQSMARVPLVRLLGTGHEDEVTRLLKLKRNAGTSWLIDDTEALLFEIATPLGYGKAMPGAVNADGKDANWVKEFDEMESGKDKDKTVTDVIEKPSDLSARTGKSQFTLPQRTAALRMLGVMASAKTLPLLDRTSRLADVSVREATAIALGGYADDHGLEALKRLAGDKDEKVAFAAVRSLWQRKKAPADARTRAIAMLGKGEPYHTWAAEMVASLATAEDRPLLEKLVGDESPKVRAIVHPAVLADAAADPKRLEQAMRDPETTIVVGAIKGIPASAIKQGNEMYQRLIALANDPDGDVVLAARDALMPLCPTDATGKMRFDLLTSVPYARHRAVAQLRKSKEAWAREELIAACTNPEAHTRVAALEAMFELDAATARPLVLKATLDPHRYVRLRAASLIAQIADSTQAAGIKDSLSKQNDRATKLYLEDALARAEGRPLPPPQPAANSVIGGTNNIAWLSPHGGNADSPYGAYYMLSHGNHVRDDERGEKLRKAHDAGKAFFYRVDPVGNPGTIMVDGLAQDYYWLYLDDQLDTPHLPYIDGLVYGEESMSMSPDALWPLAWRFFCEETGIDPARVNGDMKNLNPYEARAWNTWGVRRCVEGFNRLYDYTKLKFGKLHPGIQVCTFLPEQGFGGAPNPADFEWKFDVGGIYHYVDDTRKTAFSLVRRYKTIWPDRPVLWLSNGIGVYERTPIQYTYKAPTEPIVGRSYRAYTDALTAWMAGADTGWFSIWAFLPWDWVNAGITSLKGPTVGPEDMTPESPQLRMCIDFAFAGVDDMLRNKQGVADVAAKPIELERSKDEKKVDDMIDAMAKPTGPDSIAKQVLQDKDAMYVGFQFYRKHLTDLARLFASLPRNNTKSDTLVVQPGLDLWGGAVGSPGTDLLNFYDFVLDINQSTRLDLPRYKLIAVKDPGALTDATITALTKWLKENPGVLYVHIDLTADNTQQYGTPEAFDGKLKLDWPWEADLAVVAPAKDAKPVKADAALQLVGGDGAAFAVPGGSVLRTFKLGGANTRALLSHDKSPVLAIWQHPQFKGVVVFDGVDGGGKVYRERIRTVLNELKTKSNVGIAIDGPIRHEMLAGNGWIAETTAGSQVEHKLKGNDMLTGALNPVVGTYKSAAFVATDFQGRFAASLNGVSVLCDQPIKKIEKTDGGIVIECDGLMQASSVTGKLDVKPVKGDAIKAIKDEDLNRWVIFDNTSGIATQATGDGKESDPATLVYVRYNGAVTIRTK